ncbi:hypothetical protein TIFTF001_013302 [Ficus carica]|uniref:C2H2-type domain-containing protein n=1 Tax=Ficus carica TaxID=3494 RepID=A0AA88D2S3_FICCA|nr:hypothetical protein TIFTF001_013302 [Ficus carica]
MIVVLFVRRRFNGLHTDPAATGRSAQPALFDSDSSAKIVDVACARASLESFLSPRLSNVIVPVSSIPRSNSVSFIKAVIFNTGILALGDYTRMINDFAIFPADPTEGQVGTYWYHEGTQAYFDDSDHYKMIKAMCRLSCGVCDETNERRSNGFKRKGDFKNVDQLRSHLVNRHRLLMCSLCLESRKVFVSEQKFYTKAQLDQHIKTGDSDVDGSETERGGFMGHPMCEFCQNPFYGENELYTHMSTEHYTCHICQRQHPGQYEYYKDYDDLEASCSLFIHFRQVHFLCEDEACLEKKFVVFATESEMKRHNATEHGGRLSRCKRVAALQIPISFQYRRSIQQDRRGRGRSFSSDLANNQLSPSIHHSLESANAESSRDTSSSAGAVSNLRETSEFESVGSFDVLATTGCEPSSISSHTSRQNPGTGQLEDSSFPPLPAAPGRGKKKTKNAFGGLGGNSTTNLVNHRNNAALTIDNTPPVWPIANCPPNSLLPSSQKLRPVSNSGLLSSSSSPGVLQCRSTTMSTHLSPSYESTVSVRQVKPHEPPSSGTGSSSRNSTTKNTFTHTASSPKLSGRGFFDNSISSFPPVSAALSGKTTASGQTLPKPEDVNTANKSLVGRIRVALEHDENKYAAFKEISAQYRQDLISTEEYLACVCQFGLSHLVLELARLCPDPEKQRELVETYKFNTGSYDSPANNLSNDSGPSKVKRSSKKGKEKCEENEISTSKDVLADSIISSMKKLELNYKSLLDHADVLSKDDHQPAKRKSKILVDDKQNQNGSQSTGDSSNKNLGYGGAGHKQRKKTPKFLRNRLGNDAAAAAAVLEHGGSGTRPDLNEEKVDEDKDPPEGFPVGGVWQNGGGRKLVAMTQRDRRK